MTHYKEVRQLLANRDGISTAQSLIVYSDQKLKLAEKGCPRTFLLWINEAQQHFRYKIAA